MLIGSTAPFFTKVGCRPWFPLTYQLRHSRTLYALLLVLNALSKDRISTGVYAVFRDMHAVNVMGYVGTSDFGLRLFRATALPLSTIPRVESTLPVMARVPLSAGYPGFTTITSPVLLGPFALGADHDRITRTINIGCTLLVSSLRGV